MATKILFRASLAEEYELNIANKYFNIIENRAQIHSGDFIIPRYSFLPYGDELEKDCQILGAKLINSYKQHRYVADLYQWYDDIQKYTPKTYFDPSVALSQDFSGSYILKGETNSKKNQWKDSMFAATKDDVMRVYCNLANDSLIGQQTICIREFEHFKTFGYSPITGQPIIKEFRVFVVNGKIIGKGYYWINYPEIIEKYKPDVNEIPQSFLDEVINKIKSNIPAFVIDVAEREDGEWRVIEINDFTMSGLGGVDAEELYGNLAMLY